MAELGTIVAETMLHWGGKLKLVGNMNCFATQMAKLEAMLLLGLCRKRSGTALLQDQHSQLVMFPLVLNCSQQIQLPAIAPTAMAFARECSNRSNERWLYSRK